MNQHVKKWGNSLAVRIPASLGAELGFKENDQVEIRREGDAIKIEKVEVDDPTLDQLLAGITPENVHEEFDWGSAVGKEVW